MRSQTRIQFWAGLRTLGGTVITVEHGTAKVVLDFGTAYEPAKKLLDGSVLLRPQALLHDYVQLGVLPPVDGLYESAQLRGMDGIAPHVPGKPDQTAVFVTHMHLDHAFGIGLISEDIPVYMTESSRRMYRRLREIGEGIAAGNRKRFQRCDPFVPVRIGDIAVTSIPIDHDVPGACAFHVSTPDGSLLYTGDYRFHGAQPELTASAFAWARDRNTGVLISEGTTLKKTQPQTEVGQVGAFQPPHNSHLDCAREPDVAAAFGKLLRSVPGLAVFNAVRWNVERLAALADASEANGRIAVFEPESAYLLLTMTTHRRFAVYASEETVRLLDSGQAPAWLVRTRTLRPFVTAEEINLQPNRFACQNSYARLLELFEWDTVQGIYLHCDGTPLGPFDPAYAKLLDFLGARSLAFAPIRCSGHASPEQLQYTVDFMDPATLVTLHSFHPELLQAKSGQRLLPEYGTVYTLEGGRLLANGRVDT